MSLNVKHLNGDSTFLLSFSKTRGSEISDDCFTVLTDPWLEGDSTIFHPKFALAKHTIPCCIKNLSEIDPPNVIIISQDRNDHCHEGTLRQLDPALPGSIILAHPSAAKKIRGWKYFDEAKVVSMPEFNDKKSQSLIRFSIPSADGGTLGEATFAFVPTKYDITGLHNAIGITYRPDALSSASSVSLKLQSPHSPAPSTSRKYRPKTPRRQKPEDVEIPSLPGTPYDKHHSIDSQPVLPPLSFDTTPKSISSAFYFSDFDNSSNQNLQNLKNLRLEIIASTTGIEGTYCGGIADGRHSEPTSPRGQKSISVVYAPHGVSFPSLRAYAKSHLVSTAGLPLTLLLHPFDRVQNPWYLGGNISSGSSGGLEIASALQARCWISAHDEEKESSGFSVKKCVIRKHSVDEVRGLLGRAFDNRKRTAMDVRELGVGHNHILVA